MFVKDLDISLHQISEGAQRLLDRRVIDEAISLPISNQWHTASQFRVRTDGGRLVVEASDTEAACAVI